MESSHDKLPLATQSCCKRGPVGRQVDEILDVAGHRAPVEGEGEHEDGNCCHLDRRQFSNQNRDDPHNGP